MEMLRDGRPLIANGGLRVLTRSQEPSSPGYATDRPHLTLTAWTIVLGLRLSFIGKAVARFLLRRHSRSREPLIMVLALV